jgi:hypothetical protein
MDQQNKILLYTTLDGSPDLEVKLENETVWLTMMQMAELFGRDKSVISRHISSIYESGELMSEATVAKSATVQKEGNRMISREIVYYNLDMIISVGYRVNSFQGTKFRIWATQKLKEFIIKGFTMDDARLAGTKVNYFDELSQRVRSIRTSERNFWLKITAIFATSIDYHPNSEISRSFFANVQNMFHYAIHGHTAAELIVARVDCQKVNVGLATWKGDQIAAADVQIAKNFLTELELKRLNLLVEQYLSFAELQSLEQRPMYMKDWYEKLKGFFILNDKPILVHAGNIKASEGKQKALQEYQRYEKNRQYNIQHGNSVLILPSGSDPKATQPP